MNRTSSPICRRYRAWMSAGRSEPARFPRCLIPLMYGSALVMSTFAIGSSWGSLVVARQTWRNEKALRRTGRAWVRRHTRGESARSNPPANFLLIGPAHSRGMVGGEHSQTPGGSASSICLIGPSKTRGRRGSKDRWCRTMKGLDSDRRSPSGGRGWLVKNAATSQASCGEMGAARGDSPPGDPLLLFEIGCIEPRGAQFLDARTAGPPVQSLLAVGTNGQVTVWMHVRQRAIDQRAEHVVAARVWRTLIAAAPHNAAEIHLLQIDIHSGSPQLLGPDSGQVAQFANVGRRHHDDFLALVPGRSQGLLYRLVVAGGADDLNPGIGRKGGAEPEKADAVPPI